MKNIFIFLILFCSAVNADQPLSGIIRDSQTIIHVYQGENFKFKVIRNQNKLDNATLEQMARAHKISGVLMRYSTFIPGTKSYFSKILYLPFDVEENIYFTSRKGSNTKYKIPLIIFTAYLEGKIEIFWSEWIN